MKVLFCHPLPFSLAHGGAQTVTQSLMRVLPELGVEVEPLKWWDEQQRGDIIHYITRPPIADVRMAHKKGLKVVVTEFLDAPASRNAVQLFVQRIIILAARKLAGGFTERLAWDVYREADALVYAVPREWAVARYLFGAPAGRGHIIGHGLDAGAIQALSRPAPEEDYLLSIASIAPRKNSTLLAQAARLSQTPVLFIGKPYSESDIYFQQFKQLVDGKWVRYAGFVTEEEKRAFLVRARGFVLLSRFESGCVAVYEAAAAGLPLLLSDLPWATSAYPHGPRLQFQKLGGAKSVAAGLSAFYKTARRTPGTMTFPVPDWKEIGRKYLAVYEKVLRDN